jgi:hypothetical protein
MGIREEVGLEGCSSAPVYSKEKPRLSRFAMNPARFIKALPAFQKSVIK